MSHTRTSPSERPWDNEAENAKNPSVNHAREGIRSRIGRMLDGTVTAVTGAAAKAAEVASYTAGRVVEAVQSGRKAYRQGRKGKPLDHTSSAA